MITADTIGRCSQLTSIDLENLLRKSFPKDVVKKSQFLGISNGEHFVYRITYPDDDAKNGLAVTKVFVWQKGNGELVAEY